MKDPNRMYKVTNYIVDKWHEKCPDWRFMQLMSNFIAWLECDPFYMEDDEFLQKFYEYMNALHY